MHTPIVMNAALGVALALAALTRATHRSPISPGRGRSSCWMPLLVGYWLTIGLRAAAFVPSEPRASWIFNGAGIGETRAFWSGARAAWLAIVLPPAVAFAGAGDSVRCSDGARRCGIPRSWSSSSSRP